MGNLPANTAQSTPWWTLDQQKETLLRAIPLHDRFIHPDEVAALAVYLAADESSYVTGQARSVDGGYTML